MDADRSHARKLHADVRSVTGAVLQRTKHLITNATCDLEPEVARPVRPTCETEPSGHASGNLPDKRRSSRGRASHDLEDIITVIDGRPELGAEVRVADADVRNYIAAQAWRRYNLFAPSSSADVSRRTDP